MTATPATNLTTPLHIRTIRARNLPRTLLHTPTPQLQLYTQPLAPFFTSPPYPTATTTPSWPLSLSHPIPLTCRTTLAIQLLDATPQTPSLGAFSLPLLHAHVSGWYRLTHPTPPGAAGASASSGAEVYVELFVPSLCLHAPRCVPTSDMRQPTFRTTPPAHAELRRVRRETGLLFQAGVLDVAVVARKLPVAVAAPMLSVAVHDQTLRGFECSEPTEGRDEAASGGSAGASADSTPSPEHCFSLVGAVKTMASAHRCAHRVDGALQSGQLVQERVIQTWNRQYGRARRAKQRAEKRYKGQEEEGDDEGANQLGMKKRLRRRRPGRVAAKVRRTQKDGGSGREELPLQKPSDHDDYDDYDEFEDEDEDEDEEYFSANGEDDYWFGEPVKPRTEEATAQQQQQQQIQQQQKMPSSSASASVDAPATSHAKLGHDPVVDRIIADSEDSATGSASESEATPNDNPTNNGPTTPSPPSPQPNFRSVDFGTFQFFPYSQINPKSLSFEIIDHASRLVRPLNVIVADSMTLPRLCECKCSCEKRCNTYTFTYQTIATPGVTQHEAEVQINVRYQYITPAAVDNIVTPRFRELLTLMQDPPTDFINQYPHANKLTYALVGGLFTDNYPSYFEKNKQFLKEQLKLCVEKVPIHTEGSTSRNAHIIRDYIMGETRAPRSVVLICHSKGGNDALMALGQFPQIDPFVYGVVTFQAPFGGTYLVDHLHRRKYAANFVQWILKTIQRGDENAIQDMSYDSRMSSFGVTEEMGSGNEDASSSGTGTAGSGSIDDAPPCRPNILRVLRRTPVISFATYASFAILGIRTPATAAGVVSMAPAAHRITRFTGFFSDGLVTQQDARVPYADCVLLNDMMHTEPALYLPGTQYPPGALTGAALVLLFEKFRRMQDTSCTEE